LPASQPAMRPTSNMTTRLSFDMCMTVPLRAACLAVHLAVAG
jgi:hypothetical protein